MKKLITGVLLAGLFYAGSALASVNVNTASADQLAQLTGIGTVKAQAIVKERKANGAFKSLDGLTRVSGIGSKTVDNIRSQASVADDGAAPAAVKVDDKN